MLIKPLQTRIFNPPQDDIFDEVFRVAPDIKPNSIFVITSKVVAIHQGKSIPKDQIDKDELTKSEADWWLPRSQTPEDYGILTIKNDTLITSAGIDGQNSGEYYILWPDKLNEFCKQVWQILADTNVNKNFGVLIVDSRTTPLRRGAIGIGLAHYGFVPVKNYKNTRDLFGKKPRYGLANIPEALAAAAVLVMGEGDEATPFAVISELEGIEFTQDEYLMNGGNMPYVVSKEEDIYSYLFSGSEWKQGGENK